jgi:ParB-like chromosome segregation protein Spo0J
MVQNVEVSSFDLRYESYRLRNKEAEKALLGLIMEYGIRDPLEGIDGEGRRILLNGFKRYRCARKLGIETVPYTSLGTDEVMGIIQFLRIANAKSLNILEQAKLIDDLHKVHKMSVLEIARSLERGKSWVSMRLGIIEKMSEGVKQKIFRGEFPVYSYMYTIGQFIRMNSCSKDEIDEFVHSVSGKNLSIRDIYRLA